MGNIKEIKEWIENFQGTISNKDILLKYKDSDSQTIAKCLLDKSFKRKCEKKMSKNDLTELNMFDAYQAYADTDFIFVFNPKNLWLADMLYVKDKRVEESKEVIEENLEQKESSDFLAEILKYNVFPREMDFQTMLKIKAKDVKGFLSDINESLLSMDSVSLKNADIEKAKLFHLPDFSFLKAKSAFNSFLKDLVDIMDKYGHISGKDDVEAAQALFFKIIPNVINLEGQYIIDEKKGQIGYELSTHPWNHLESYVRNFTQEKQDLKMKKIKLIGKTILFATAVTEIPSILSEAKEIISAGKDMANLISTSSDGLELVEEIPIFTQDESLSKLEYRFQESGFEFFKDFLIDDIKTEVEKNLKGKFKLNIEVSQDFLNQVYSQFFNEKIRPLAMAKMNDVAEEQIKDTKDHDGFLLSIANLSIVDVEINNNSNFFC